MGFFPDFVSQSQSILSIFAVRFFSPVLPSVISSLFQNPNKDVFSDQVLTENEFCKLFESAKKCFAKSFSSRPVSCSAQRRERYFSPLSGVCSRWGCDFDLRCSCHIRLNGVLCSCTAFSGNASSHRTLLPGSITPKEAFHTGERSAEMRKVFISPNLSHQAKHPVLLKFVGDISRERYAFALHMPGLGHWLKLQLFAFVPRVNVHLFVKSVVFHFDAWSCVIFLGNLSLNFELLFVIDIASSCFRINSFLYPVMFMISIKRSQFNLAFHKIFEKMFVVLCKNVLAP